MSTRKISLLALFISLSIVGGFIKVPAIVGSVALDFFPALMAAIYLGRPSGMIVAGLGHLASAFIGGMPLGPLHIIVAIAMAVIVLGFQIIYKKGHWILAGIFVVLANALIAPLPLLFFFSAEFYIALLPSLLVGSFVNTLVALILAPRFQPIFDRLASQ